MVIRTFALTYPQLMNQAIKKGLCETDLAKLRKAYETAEQLLDGLYRAQHVPFICHVVRTASILLEESQPPEVVQSGMLHAAYSVGCFEDSRHGGSSPEHRDELKRKVGSDVETLVFSYENFPWYQRECVLEHLQKFESYDERQRKLILMRLANELEDYLDFGMAYRGVFPYREKIKAYGQEAIELARRLGRQQLADELASVFEAHLSCQLPEMVMTNQPSSFQLPALKWLKKNLFEKLQSKGTELFQKVSGVNGSEYASSGVKQ